MTRNRIACLSLTHTHTHTALLPTYGAVPAYTNNADTACLPDEITQPDEITHAHDING